MTHPQLLEQLKAVGSCQTTFDLGSEAVLALSHDNTVLIASPGITSRVPIGFVFTPSSVTSHYPLLRNYLDHFEDEFERLRTWIRRHQPQIVPTQGTFFTEPTGNFVHLEDDGAGPDLIHAEVRGGGPTIPTRLVRVSVQRPEPCELEDLVQMAMTEIAGNLVLMRPKPIHVHARWCFYPVEMSEGAWRWFKVTFGDPIDVKAVRKPRLSW